MLFSGLATRIMAKSTNLLDGLKNIEMTRETYINAILPIGLLFSFSLVLSNYAYLHLSVSFIQMIKVYELFRFSRHWLQLLFCLFSGHWKHRRLTPKYYYVCWQFRLVLWLHAMAKSTLFWLVLYFNALESYSKQPDW